MQGVYPTPIRAEIIRYIKTEPLGGCALRLSAVFKLYWELVLGCG